MHRELTFLEIILCRLTVRVVVAKIPSVPFKINGIGITHYGI